MQKKKEKKRDELTYLESRAESNSFDSSVLFAMFFLNPWSLGSRKWQDSSYVLWGFDSFKAAVFTVAVATSIEIIRPNKSDFVHSKKI